MVSSLTCESWRGFALHGATFWHVPGCVGGLRCGFEAVARCPAGSGGSCRYSDSVVESVFFGGGSFFCLFSLSVGLVQVCWRGWIFADLLVHNMGL